MAQFFSKPDLYIGRCGRLNAQVHHQAIPGAPPFMKGLKALFVTDVHVLPKTSDEDLDGLIALMKAQLADIVLLGGDYADDHAQTVRFFQALSRLPRPKYGLLGILGNNDREAWPDIEPLRALMAKAGCTLLVNEARWINAGGGRLCVAGLDEALWGHPDARGLYPETSSGDVFRLLLRHQPRFCEPRPDLMLSGHTHGGQFNLLGITPYTIGFERLRYPGFAPQTICGLRSIGGIPVYTSKGIGASRIQWRVGVRPQIDVLTF